MNIFETIKGLFEQPIPSQATLTDHCPNCWGKQEFGGRFFDAVLKKDINLNNIKAKKGWIEAYAAKHLLGIRLQKQAEGHSCPTCKVVYKPS